MRKRCGLFDERFVGKGNTMAGALIHDRLQFAVTATFHYLVTQLTMGRALLLFYLNSRALWTGESHYRDAVLSISLSE
jgi:cytochrome bd-type quinol oxidase subunit 1